MNTFGDDFFYRASSPNVLECTREELSEQSVLVIALPYDYQYYFDKHNGFDRVTG